MVRVLGGDKAAAYLDNIANNASKAHQVDIGFLEEAKYADGTPVAMVAAIQEFGAPKVGIPPRPFFRTMVATKKSEWPKAVGDLLVANDYDTWKTLAQTGEGIKGQLQQSIVDLVDPALSDTTLMLRKMKMLTPGLQVNKTVVGEARARVAAGESTAGVSTKPLVESGQMLNSVDYVVK